jgi:hypothetical protein
MSSHLCATTISLFPFIKRTFGCIAAGLTRSGHADSSLISLPPSLEQVSFRVVDSPTKFQPHGAPANASVSNAGKVQAHNNSMFSIAPVRAV